MRGTASGCGAMGAYSGTGTVVQGRAAGLQAWWRKMNTAV